MGERSRQLRGACDALRERCAVGAAGARGALEALDRGDEAGARSLLAALAEGLTLPATDLSRCERLEARIRELEAQLRLASPQPFSQVAAPGVISAEDRIPPHNP